MFSKHGLEVEDVKAEQQILSVDILSHSEFPVRAESRDQHRRTLTVPTTTTSFSQKLCCILVFLSYVFHPLYVHFTHHSLTERPKPQEQDRKPRAHLTNGCHLSRRKSMCVEPQRSVFDHTSHVTFECQMFHPSRAHSNFCRDSSMILM